MKRNKKYNKLKEYALRYVRTLPKEDKKYIDIDFNEKYHTNEYLANEYVKQYEKRKELGLGSFLYGFMKSRSKDINQRIHLAEYYDLIGSFEQRETQINRDARIRLANKQHKNIEITNEFLTFREKYGEEVFIDRNSKYNGYSINELLELFKSHDIEKNELNKILRNFKSSNTKYIKSGSS